QYSLSRLSSACCSVFPCLPLALVFFFSDPATPQIYTLSLHDALPIYPPRRAHGTLQPPAESVIVGYYTSAEVHLPGLPVSLPPRDRKSTRLNSSHVSISYAVFCLKKKKKEKDTRTPMQIETVDRQERS